jgi:hypothetical protein
LTPSGRRSDSVGQQNTRKGGVIDRDRIEWSVLGPNGVEPNQANGGSMPSLLGIDNGLTISKAVLFDIDGTQLSVARRRVPQSMPHPRWVERDMVGLRRDLVATILERRDFKGCRRKSLPIFVSGADHAFQASFERQTAYSSPAPSGDKLARI